jgi:FHA domain-containing protein/zinc ribbon family protein
LEEEVVVASGETETVQETSEIHDAGDSTVELNGPGSLVCTDCGFAISLTALDEMPSSSTLPTCSACGGTKFRRGSIFDRHTMDTDAIVPELSAPAWLAEARVDATDEPHVAWFDADGEGPCLIRLPEGWSRIGRGEAADIRLDDPSVSRRHALIVRTETGELRALDDRSLNGLFVNGEKVDWTKLEDGDELEIGSFRLYIIDPD